MFSWFTGNSAAPRAHSASSWTRGVSRGSEIAIPALPAIERSTHCDRSMVSTSGLVVSETM